MSKSGLLVVDSMCVGGVVSRDLFAPINIINFNSGINPYFVPTEAELINKLSPTQNSNNLSVNLDLYNVSTAPIRAITKYLNNLLLITRRK
jgi:hypothetical protein